MNLRSTILEAQDIGTETVPVKEWGVQVKVRGLSAGERNAITLDSRDSEGNVQGSLLQARVVVRCLFDPETGERIFADDDVNALLEKASGVIDRLSTVALALSGLNEQNDQVKAVEEAGKAS